MPIAAAQAWRAGFCPNLAPLAKAQLRNLGCAVTRVRLLVAITNLGREQIQTVKPPRAPWKGARGGVSEQLAAAGRVIRGLQQASAD